jgi:hypothetical protein
MSLKKTFKTFHKDYGIYLLRTPHARLSLADFAEIAKRFFLDIEEKNIIDDLDFDSETRKKFRTHFQELKTVNANLPDVQLESDLLSSVNLSIPAAKVSGGYKLDASKVLDYNFGDIQAKVLRNTNEFEVRNLIENEIEEMGRRELRKELGKIRRTYFIERLYYANSVSITMDKSFKLSVEAEAGIKDLADFEVKIQKDASDKQQISITGPSDVPFAASVINLKDLWK